MLAVRWPLGLPPPTALEQMQINANAQPCGQWAVASGEWAVASGEWAVASGALGSGKWGVAAALEPLSQEAKSQEPRGTEAKRPRGQEA